MLAMIPLKQCSKSMPGRVELFVACTVCDNIMFKFRFYEPLEEQSVCFSCTEKDKTMMLHNCTCSAVE